MRAIVVPLVAIAACAVAYEFDVACSGGLACQTGQTCCSHPVGMTKCCAPGTRCGNAGHCISDDGVLVAALPALVTPAYLHEPLVLEPRAAASAAYLNVSCTSYDLGPHCLEIDVPGGKDSDFWKADGWRYTPPLWNEGNCDRSVFTIINKIIPDLNGYKGVVQYQFGKQ